ncbi:MAG: DUF3784 domain-containing protein [Clostridia bacterium]|nr:DUF3784 domain-containing protein [Clostridia bacterium]
MTAMMWICFAITLLCVPLSVLSFLQKGFLFNNAYLYASKQERETMYKTPYYRQSGVVFLLIGVIFLCNGLALALHKEWLFGLAHITLAVTLVYAIVSSVVIEKRKKKGETDENA